MFRKPASEKWCCDWLRQSFADRHGRGIYVYVEPPREYVPEFAFRIGMRSVEQQYLEQSIGVTNMPVTLSTSRRIFYCPGCGKNLAKFYRKNYKQLVDDEIVAEHTAWLNNSSPANP